MAPMDAAALAPPSNEAGKAQNAGKRAFTPIATIENITTPSATLLPAHKLPTSPTLVAM